METNAAVDPVDSNSLTSVLAHVGSEPLTEQGFEEVALTAFASEQNFHGLTNLLNDWAPVEKTLPSEAVSELLRGFCALIVGKSDIASDALLPQKGEPWGAYHLARTVLDNGRATDAVEIAGAVYTKNSDFLPLAHLLVEAHTRLKNFDDAKGILDKIEAVGSESATFHFASGIYLEAIGEYADAIAAYRRAVSVESRYTEAHFRLGYLVDLHGSDADEANDEAVAAYEACVKTGRVCVNAVINLGLLYEDRERYHDAIKCYETVLRYYPNHARAKLYLGDAQAATTMFYDREQEKKADRQSQVLKIPVTDFELSVRSRNCLQKMNIRTLGDLIMKSEQELLAYKNFGETSLDEIKNMLTQKGLRLGQGLEEGGSEPTHGRNPLEATTDPAVLDKSIDDLELSVRSRRCMERLGIRSVRDLINKTEVELMAAKNFGMTSLNEIKRKLKELGLDLRS